MTSVLVVDDDLPLSRALVRSLRLHGYESMAANGHDDALKKVSERPFDVVLTDLRMQGKDGLDLIAALSESCPSTRAILMSAYATARDSQQAMDSGAVRILCKPFETSELISAIERAAESRSGFMGDVHGLSLLDLLRLLHLSERSLSVCIGGGIVGSVHLEEGRVVHATFGPLEGEQALEGLLELPAGVVRTGPLEKVPTTIRLSFDELEAQFAAVRPKKRSPSRALRAVGQGEAASERPSFPDGFNMGGAQIVASQKDVLSALAERALTYVTESWAGGAYAAAGSLCWKVREGQTLELSPTTEAGLVSSLQRLIAEWDRRNRQEDPSSDTSERPSVISLRGELQLNTDWGVLLAKVSPFGQVVLALVPGHCSDIERSWQQLRLALKPTADRSNG